MNTQQTASCPLERATQAMKENRWADAVSDFKIAHEQSPNDLDISGQLGFALSRNEQYQDAIQIFEELALKQPTDAK